MVRKVDGLDALGFDIAAYRKRLQMMRKIICGENQKEFADLVGIEHKRWNNYEQGYPIPRHVAMMLMTKLGVSIEWLWFGQRWEGNLTADFRDKLRALEAIERRQEKAQLKVITSQKPSPRPQPVAKDRRTRKSSRRGQD